jgi:hypothetical protein
MDQNPLAHFADSSGRDSQPGYRDHSALAWDNQPDCRSHLDHSPMAARQAAVGIAAPDYIASQGMVAETVAPAVAAVRRFSRKSLYAAKLEDYYMALMDEKQIQSKSGYISLSNALKSQPDI